MVTHSFPRVAGDVAGAFIWRLGEALVIRGHTVTVIAPADHGIVGEPMLGKVRVRRVRYSYPAGENLAYTGEMQKAASGPLGAINFLQMLRRLAGAVTQEVRSQAAHIVHAHWWVPGGLAVRYGDTAGRPYVVTMHGTDVAIAKKLPGGRALMRTVLERAAAVTCVSSFLAAEAAAVLKVTANSIPLTPMPLALGLSADPDAAGHGVIFVGRLTRQKGVASLLEALAILKREGAPLDLTIVGDGPERAALKARAIALGIPAVFTGFVEPREVASHLRDKRVFVLPAIDEGLGLVVAEALTQGVPVVATRSGGIPDLLYDPDAGLLVPPEDPPALAKAIKEVMGSDRFKVGALRAGRALAERLSPERVAERFESIYLKCRAPRDTIGKPPRTSKSGG